MMKQLIKNRELLTVVFVFLIIALSLLLGLFLSLEQILICLFPIFIIFLLFRDWLRGREKAKDFKKFMIFRIIVMIIFLVIMSLYILSMYQNNQFTNPLYIFGWFIVLFITDIIENKYFIKKNRVNNNQETKKAGTV
ncbi:hypothetical protein NGB92_12955 [Mammaliicoccus sciuri]|nr:hypothetical protein [Mammaliicoccus sciuri]MCJ0920096.1 hypothetical protein [Mammaliicoccus sciuri]MCJ0957795.1 hypothetical protein [Mammaliicoccus sciuri]MCJ0962830.1 hypothetical protein [Mammaliicoccus sciuri]MEB5650193.1 hypothetical protein [Mammaliicoccus sciuri]MEB7415433.1 hypothetical protein [Mammaliicoccus sciuri]